VAVGKRYREKRKVWHRGVASTRSVKYHAVKAAGKTPARAGLKFRLATTRGFLESPTSEHSKGNIGENAPRMQGGESARRLKEKRSHERRHQVMKGGRIWFAALTWAVT